MKKKVIIVESPSKAKTISKFLDSTFKILASGGHVVDLPESHLGVDVSKNFEPEWVLLKGKKKILELLKKECKTADTVYLATDPDREGEAISYHLNRLLKLKKYSRIKLKEITPEEIKEKIQIEEKINLNLVESQIARRILDRITGYTFSPTLWKISKNLSAGRVQSPVLRWICEREKEIQNFKIENFYMLKGLFKHKKSGFEVRAKLVENKKDKFSEEEIKKILLKKFKNPSKNEREILQPPSNYREKFILKELKITNKKEYPPPPFNTSTLQKEASSKFGFSPTKTMKLAQSLYEGKNSSGLITYMRTDSSRVSNRGIGMALKYLKENTDLPIHSGFQRNFKKGKEDAHECIRPTFLTKNEVDYNLSQDEKKLYELIRDRFITSFLSPIEKKIYRGFLFSGELEFEFRIEEILNRGFLEYKEKNGMMIKIPEFQINDEFISEFLEVEEGVTEPPSRYRESTLIHKMEKTGIGRPSTYANTLETLYKRGYIQKIDKELLPTSMGKLVNTEIQNRFGEFIKDEYTSKMEKNLDLISKGEIGRYTILRELYDSLKKTKPPVEAPQKMKCPGCGEGFLRKKLSREKKVYSICSRFPYCEYVQYESEVKK